MCAPPILAFKESRLELRAALNAGWNREDLYWERLQERSNERLRAQRRIAAAAGFAAAFAIARVRFGAGDLRRPASRANLAFALRALGAERSARKGYAAAKAEWAGASGAMESAEIKPRARSSLFHMRMEARHWDTYKLNRIARLRKFHEEAAECLSELERGRPAPHRLYSRWLGEKPAVHDDARKILGACLLLASDPPA